MGSRLAIWAMIGVGAVDLTFAWHLAFDIHTIKDFVGTKLAILAVLAAVGVFQYQVFRSIIERAYSNYVVGVVQFGPANVVAELRAEVLNSFIPHNEAVLADVLFSAGVLLVSASADLVNSTGAGNRARAVDRSFDNESTSCLYDRSSILADVRKGIRILARTFWLVGWSSWVSQELKCFKELQHLEGHGIDAEEGTPAQKAC